jgi:hypothetical protein
LRGNVFLSGLGALAVCLLPLARGEIQVEGLYEKLRRSKNSLAHWIITPSLPGGKKYQPMSFGEINLERGRKKGGKCKRKRKKEEREREKGK